MQFPIQYDEPVFRPPSEGKAFLIQVTIGCSNNLCTYCKMYRTKSYKVRELSDIFSDLEKSAQYFKEMGYSPMRLFLCDGDALGAPMDILVPTLEKINELYPNLDRIGIYATAENMLEKTDLELQKLASLKLNMAYLGMESGSDKVLHMVVKGNTQADMIEGSLKIKRNGWKLSTIAMLGLGGRKHSKTHVEETIKVINATSPEYFSFLTTMALPGTPYHTMVERGMLEMLTTKELLSEMKEIIAGINPINNDILFRANHVSNQYPLGGTLPRDNTQIVQTLDSWIGQTPVGVYPPTPSSM